MGQQRRLQRAVHDQPGVAFLTGDIGLVIVDAMAVEGERGVAEQEYGICCNLLAVRAGRGGVGLGLWRSGIDTAIDDVLALGDRGAIAV